jgi:NAD-dependent SIR2 family protein deacetylase
MVTTTGFYKPLAPLDGMADRIQQLAAELRDADQAVAFTGAGVSTASGIPDFRSVGGIWSKYDPEQFHHRAFERNPGVFWERFLDMHAEAFAGGHEPNSAHRALARSNDRAISARSLRRTPTGSTRPLAR